MKQNDPRKLLNHMLNDSGGVRLAAFLMTDTLEHQVKVLFTAEQACCSWYTKEIEETKHPRNGLLYSMLMADGGWMREPHIWETMDSTQSLFDRDNLEFMGIPQGVSTMVGRTTELVLNIAHQNAMPSLCPAVRSQPVHCCRASKTPGHQYSAAGGGAEAC